MAAQQPYQPVDYSQIWNDSIRPMRQGLANLSSNTAGTIGGYDTSKPLFAAIQNYTPSNDYSDYSVPATTQGVVKDAPMDLSKLNSAISGINTLGQLYGAYQAQKLGNKQFAFQKALTERNLANSSLDYNTRLENKMAQKAALDGVTPEAQEAYLNSHRVRGTV
jgi:hypothetical protein